MKASIFTSAVWIVAMCAPLVPAQDSALDLKTALQMAENNNLELRAVRQQRAISLAGITIAKALINPTLTASVSRHAPHQPSLLGDTFEISGKSGTRTAIAR